MLQVMEKSKVTVEISGQNYTIIGDNTEEHIRQVATEVNELINIIRDKYPNVSSGRIAVLAAVNLADELIRMRQEYQSLIDIIEEEKENC